MSSNVIIEPLDTDRHDRAAFSSGVEQVDNFLRRTAGRLMKGGTIQVFVMVDSNDDLARILGFYSLNAHCVSCGDLPRRYKRFANADGSISAAFIGMIGVTQKAQGQGVGRRLLIDALNGAYTVSLRMGTAVVLLDILDCGNPQVVTRRQRLYEGFGFQALASNPLRMFMSMATVAQLQE